MLLAGALRFKIMKKSTLVPEVFLDFSTLEMREPRRGDRYKYYLVAKRLERKTSGYFGLESHFHAGARVRI